MTDCYGLAGWVGAGAILREPGATPPPRQTMTEQQALAVIKRYYRDDPEGMESDRRVTLQRGETLQQWAESLLDPLS